jgi:hypothetical protein
MLNYYIYVLILTSLEYQLRKYKSIIVAFDHALKNNLGYSLAAKLKSNSCIIIHNEVLKTHSENKNGTSFLNVGTSSLFLEESEFDKIKIELNEVEYHNSLNIINRYKYQFNRFLTTDIKTSRLINDLLSYSYHLLHDYEVDVAFLPSIPHQKLDYFIYLVAIRLKIKILFINPFPIIDTKKFHFFLSDQFNSFGSDYEFQYSEFNESEYNSIPLIDYFHTYSLQGSQNNKKQVISLINSPTLVSRLTRKILSFIKYTSGYGFIKALTRTYFSIMESIVLKFESLRSKELLEYYRLLSKNKLNYKEEFIYFPLHFQPEATTIPAGNYYSNQLKVIESLLKYLPERIHVYVKEHPAYLSETKVPMSLYRNKKFYDEIISNSRCKILPMNIDSKLLINISIAVATVTGTVSLEALRLKKTSLIFGDSLYSKLPNAILVNQFDKGLYYSILKKNSQLNENHFLSFLNDIDKKLLTVEGDIIGYSNSKNIRTKMNKEIIEKLDIYENYL